MCCSMAADQQARRNGNGAYEARLIEFRHGLFS
jgi:hypothetical protein